MTDLPPLRRIDPNAVTPAPASAVKTFAGGDDRVAAAFGAVLAASRSSRGLQATGLILFSPIGKRANLPPAPPEGRIWAPHLAAIAESRVIVWEAAFPRDLEAALEASTDDIVIWAAQPEALLALADSAPRFSNTYTYLSLRWILAHPRRAGMAASANVAFEHVSVHTTAKEMPKVRAVLRALGMVEVPRPHAIATPGHWLACGPVRVHLNARADVAPAGVGTAPNHICFAVTDLDLAQAAVEAHGFSTQRAGSLGGQVWFRIASGTVIELQPRTERLLANTDPLRTRGADRDFAD